MSKLQILEDRYTFILLMIFTNKSDKFDTVRYLDLP